MTLDCPYCNICESTMPRLAAHILRDHSGFTERVIVSDSQPHYPLILWATRNGVRCWCGRWFRRTSRVTSRSGIPWHQHLETHGGAVAHLLKLTLLSKENP